MCTHNSSYQRVRISSIINMHSATPTAPTIDAIIIIGSVGGKSVADVDSVVLVVVGLSKVIPSMVVVSMVVVSMVVVSMVVVSMVVAMVVAMVVVSMVVAMFGVVVAMFGVVAMVGVVVAGVSPGETRQCGSNSTSSKHATPF